MQSGSDVIDSESSSSESGEEIDLLEELRDPDFLRTLGLAKKGALRDVAPLPRSDSSDQSLSTRKKRKREKPILLKDVQAEGNSEEEEDEEEPSFHRKSRPYVQDLEESRRAFLQAAGAEDEATEDLFAKSIAQTAGAKAGRRSEVESSTQKLLDAYFGKDEDLNEDDLFLKRFVSQKGLDADEDRAEDQPGGWQVRDDSEDEKHLEEADRYEAAHNFRYEEAGADAVKTHPRNVDGVVRQSDQRRAEARERRKQRKGEEKARRQAETQRLKNVKRSEIEERLQQVQQEAGLEGSNPTLEALLASADFNEEDYDAAMQSLFDASFYEGGQDDAPLADDEEAAGAAMAKDSKETLPKPAGAAATAEQAAAIKGLVDEYNKLDYEDVVAGIPTRFGYKQVEKVDYGLSTEDILTLTDKELNRIVGLKRLATYKQDRDRRKAQFQGRHRLNALKAEKGREASEAAAAPLPRKADAEPALETEAEAARARARRLSTFAKPQVISKPIKSRKPEVTVEEKRTASGKRRLRRLRAKQNAQAQTAD